MNNFCKLSIKDTRLLDFVKSEVEKRERVALENERLTNNHEEKFVIAHSKWLSTLDDSNFRKQTRIINKVVENELKEANKALVQVRRAALYYKLNAEHNTFVDELKAQGKALYVKR